MNLKYLSGVLLTVALLSSSVLWDYSHAGSPAQTGEATTREQLVHKMVNGTLVVEKEQVQMTVTKVPPFPTLLSVDEKPWYVLNGYDSKVMPLLQKEIGHGKTNCPANLGDFAECPPLERDSEGNDIVNVYIVLGPAPMWPDGWPDEQNYPTAEQRAKRFAELTDMAADQQQPVVDLLNINNHTVIEQDLGLNHISADVTVNFLPELEAFDEVLFIESRNKFYSAQLLESRQITGVEQAKYLGYNGSGTIVGIIDSGLAIVAGSYDDVAKTATPKHRDLDDIPTTGEAKLNKIVDFHRYDTYGNDPDDCDGHGTKVAGVISGTGTVNPAYSGYAPNSKINVYKTSLSCSEFHTVNKILDAMNLAATVDNVDVLNLSLGSSDFDPDGTDSISRGADQAFRDGTAIVVAVGNYRDPQPSHPSAPSSAHNVLAVGSVARDDTDSKVWYSSHGGTDDGRIKPDLMAPVDPTWRGGGMMTTDLGGTDTYNLVSGTSFAAPQVAGAIANIIEQYKRNHITLEPGRIYAMMLSQALGNRTGDDGLRMDNFVGAGVLNMRYNVMETHSGHVEVSGNDHATFSMDVPTNAERLTIALWWPESYNDVHNKVDLELYDRNSTMVAYSAAGSATGDSSSNNVPYGPVSQRLIVDDPATGTEAYSVRVQADNIGPETQKVFYSYTFMLPNSPPVTEPQEITVKAGIPVEITLAGEDSDRDIVGFYLSKSPTNGTLSPASSSGIYLPRVSDTPTYVTYTPHSEASGTDSFEVTPWDGLDAGTPVAMTINIQESRSTYCKENLAVDELVALTDTYNVMDNRTVSNSVTTITGTNGTDLILAPDHAVIITGWDGDDCIIGGAGNDIIYGNSGDDHTYGGAGDDAITSGPGNDDAYGDEGNDLIHGDAGDDTLDGGGGNDYFSGGDGADTIYGGPGDDTLVGRAGDDRIRGGNGTDTIHGDEGADTIYGGPDADTIYGGPDADTIYGGPDDDYIDGGGPGPDDDYIDGGPGHNNIVHYVVDTMTYCENKTIGELMALTDNNGAKIYNVIDKRSDDSVADVTGTNMADLILTNDRGITVSGGPGDDCIIGGAGHDYIDGNGGDDTVYGKAGADVIDGGLGHDTLHGGDIDDTIYGGSGNDLIYGGPGDNILLGELGDDLLCGGPGNDRLDSDEGVDTLYPGYGGDSIATDPEGDNLVFDHVPGIDVCTPAKERTDPDTIGTNTVCSMWDIDAAIAEAKASEEYHLLDLRNQTGISVFVNGTTGADLILAPGAGTFMRNETHTDDGVHVDVLGVVVYGGPGNDCIIGGPGDDTLYGGNGHDTMWGGDGDDFVYGQNDNDELRGNRGSDLLDGGAGYSFIAADENDAMSDPFELILSKSKITVTEGANHTVTYTVGLRSQPTGDVTISVLSSDESVAIVSPTQLSFGMSDWNTPQSVAVTGIDDLSDNGGIRTAIITHVPTGGGYDTAVDVRMLTIGVVDDDDDSKGLDDISIGGNAQLDISVEPTYCDGMTIDELMESGIYTVIDKRNADPGVTQIDGTTSDDLILAPEHGVTIYGKKGNDCIIGGAGDDTLRGGGGSDTMYGNGGSDTLRGAGGDDMLYGGNGNDEIYGDAGNDEIYGGPGDDTVNGQNGNDLIHGGAGADDLRGNKGNDTITGDDNDTRIAGGQGTDTCTDTPVTKGNCENLN